MKESSRFFSNRKCEFFPCHKTTGEFNCLFCYCPMYHFENCPGNPAFKEKHGRRIKVCTGCDYPHRPENYDSVIEFLSKKNNRL
ncbi:MAG: cysteine-rich small domain-containing protein [Lachnospiraceae bacterium]|nr:cysteine-rich small domain-containing protein [Lachnospiraceae bacterium]MDY6220924.1 cysteine-rich small domain-containing protein [Candidatus Alectryocaccobium sp.]